MTKITEVMKKKPNMYTDVIGLLLNICNLCQTRGQWATSFQTRMVSFIYLTVVKSLYFLCHSINGFTFPAYIFSLT